MKAPTPPKQVRRELYENGYGISVLEESDGETFEFAVLTHQRGLHPRLTYDTAVTCDVVRHCTPTSVESLADRVRALPPR